MTKRQRTAPVAQAEKAKVELPFNVTRPTSLVPSPSSVGVALSHPDSVKDELMQFGFGLNPLSAYRRETNFFTRRRMLYEFSMRCPALMAAVGSVSDQIAAQEVYITPLETNPSASTLLLAQRAVELINNAGGKSDGTLDFIKLFVESYWLSKTGAFILTPKDSGGKIQAISILNPMQPYPLYDFEQVTYGVLNPGKVATQPIIRPKLMDTQGNLINQIQGIWYVDGYPMGANYFTLPPEQYHQVAPGAVGWGAFLTTIPRVEAMLPHVLAYAALVEYLLDTVLCTDQSQAVIWQNVDPAVLKAYSNKRKEILRKRMNNLVVDPEDEGKRLHVTAREPDKPAGAQVVNFRAFPADFDIMKTLASLETTIALGLAVNPRRVSPGVQTERFGNAQQAAMLNSDEPGVIALKQSITQFLSGVLLQGVPLRADFMASNSPENYALVSKDQAVAQVISQIGDAWTTEQKTAYMVRQGTMLPSEVGIPSMRTGDGNPGVSTKAERGIKPRGYASLRWPDGNPIVFNPPIRVDPRWHPLSEHVRSMQLVSKKAGVFDPEGCALEAVGRYEDWITNDLPHLVKAHGFSHSSLEMDITDLTNLLYAAMIACAKSQIGDIRSDPTMRSVIDTTKSSFFNAFGPPSMRGGSLRKPKNNLFDRLWALHGKLLLGSATLAQVQQTAASFTAYIPRYFNGLRALESIQIGNEIEATATSNGQPMPVFWKRNATESCGDCIRFEGSYSSFKSMLQRTGGLVPGDVRLTCSGNCKCNLISG